MLGPSRKERVPRGRKVALKSSNQHIPPTFPFSLWLISHLYSTCSLVSYSFRIDWYGPERQFTAHFLLVYCGDPDLNSPPLMWGRRAVRKLESNRSQWSSMIAKCSPGGLERGPIQTRTSSEQGRTTFEPCPVVHCPTFQISQH